MSASHRTTVLPTKEKTGSGREGCVNSDETGGTEGLESVYREALVSDWWPEIGTQGFGISLIRRQVRRMSSLMWFWFLNLCYR